MKKYADVLYMIKKAAEGAIKEHPSLARVRRIRESLGNGMKKRVAKDVQRAKTAQPLDKNSPQNTLHSKPMQAVLNTWDAIFPSPGTTDNYNPGVVPTRDLRPDGSSAQREPTFRQRRDAQSQKLYGKDWDTARRDMDINSVQAKYKDQVKNIWRDKNHSRMLSGNKHDGEHDFALEEADRERQAQIDKINRMHELSTKLRTQGELSADQQIQLHNLYDNPYIAAMRNEDPDVARYAANKARERGYVPEFNEANVAMSQQYPTNHQGYSEENGPNMNSSLDPLNYEPQPTKPFNPIVLQDLRDMQIHYDQMGNAHLGPDKQPDTAPAAATPLPTQKAAVPAPAAAPKAPAPVAAPKAAAPRTPATPAARPPQQSASVPQAAGQQSAQSAPQQENSSYNPGWTQESEVTGDTSQQENDSYNPGWTPENETYEDAPAAPDTNTVATAASQQKVPAVPQAPPAPRTPATPAARPPQQPVNDAQNQQNTQQPTIPAQQNQQRTTASRPGMVQVERGVWVPQNQAAKFKAAQTRPGMTAVTPPGGGTIWTAGNGNSTNNINPARQQPAAPQFKTQLKPDNQLTPAQRAARQQVQKQMATEGYPSLASRLVAMPKDRVFDSQEQMRTYFKNDPERIARYKRSLQQDASRTRFIARHQLRNGIRNAVDDIGRAATDAVQSFVGGMRNIHRGVTNPGTAVPRTPTVSAQQNQQRTTASRPGMVQVERGVWVPQNQAAKFKPVNNIPNSRSGRYNRPPRIVYRRAMPRAMRGRVI